MHIPPNSPALPAARPQENAPSTPAKSSVTDMLRSLVIVEKLSALVGASTPPSIDQALDKFWEGMIDDCAYRTRPELARHNYHRDLGHLEHQGGRLQRAVEEMPAGAPRTQAREKLGRFLEEQRAQIELRYERERSGSCRLSPPKLVGVELPPPALGAETP